MNKSANKSANKFWSVDYQPTTSLTHKELLAQLEKIWAECYSHKLKGRPRE